MSVFTVSESYAANNLPDFDINLYGEHNPGFFEDVDNSKAVAAVYGQYLGDRDDHSYGKAAVDLLRYMMTKRIKNAAWDFIEKGLSIAMMNSPGAIEGGGVNIALGSRAGGLRDFASEIGAEHLLDLDESAWQDIFLAHVADPTATFSVNMAGFYGDSFEQMILNEIGSGSNTGWELKQLQEAGRLSEVNFYQNGSSTLIVNPFQ